MTNKERMNDHEIKLEDLICKSGRDEAQNYFNFFSAVKSEMICPEWICDFKLGDIYDILDYGGMIYNFYNLSDPVCSTMYIPIDKYDLDSMRIRATFEEAEEYVEFGPMFVLKKYRGRGLQRQMIAFLERELPPRYKKAIGTVHPDNVYSKKNLLRSGFKYSKTNKSEYGITKIYIKTFR